MGRNVNVMDINADNIDVLDSNESEFLPALKCMEKDITLMVCCFSLIYIIYLLEIGCDSQAIHG